MIIDGDRPFGRSFEILGLHGSPWQNAIGEGGKTGTKKSRAKIREMNAICQCPETNKVKEMSCFSQVQWTMSIVYTVAT
jgi:hypothetical protein